jgi:hypothetical protein
MSHRSRSHNVTRVVRLHIHEVIKVDVRCRYIPERRVVAYFLHARWPTNR